MFNKNCFRIICSLVFLFVAMRFYYAMTDDFRLQNISYPEKMRPISTPYFATIDQQLLEPIFAQRFFYLGKGAQSYAFSSEDGVFVLKFFKFKHLKPNWLMQILPDFPPLIAWKKRYLQRKEKKFQSVFQGYALAYQKNKERAGLIYLQLEPNPTLQLQARVIDKVGRERMVSLKNTCFLLQKKGIPLREYLHPLFLAEQIPLAKESLKAILAMYVEEYTQGIYDRDHGLLQNTGFLGNTPFHLDVGKMVENPSMQSPHIYKKDLEWVIWKINAWIKKHYPAHSQEIGAFLAEEYTFLVHEQLPVPPLSEASWKAEARYENEQKIS